MNIENILAVPVLLDYDKDKVAQEMTNLYNHPTCNIFGRDDRHFKQCRSLELFSQDEQDELYKLNYYTLVDGEPVITSNNAPYLGRSIYLRHDREDFTTTFLRTKLVDTNDWWWRKDIDIDYTKSVIDSLPFFKTIGMIRVFMFKDTYLPTHRDYGFELNPYEFSKNVDYCLGLSLIPSTGGVPMRIWSEKEKKVVSVYGESMMFNDSVMHAVPKTNGIRITIRIFGNLNHDALASYIDESQCHWLT